MDGNWEITVRTISLLNPTLACLIHALLDQLEAYKELGTIYHHLRTSKQEQLQRATLTPSAPAVDMKHVTGKN